MFKDIKYTLSNGIEIPALSFGTWQVKPGDEAYTSVLWALEAGYRHIDTAYVYENEESVGKAIHDSNVKREDIFLTTKLPAEIKSYDGALEYFERSLKNLATDYIDLYLIHAPWPWSDVGGDYTSGNVDAWRAIVKLYNEKKIRAIGVSNFHPENIIPLIEATGVKPMCNQIRYFIGNTQDRIVEYCKANDILVEAYSPLATGNLLDLKEIKDLAVKYNTTPAKICIRYCIQKGTVVLIKSIKRDRIIDNMEVDFEISADDMNYLDSLHHIGPTRPLRS